jgi:hypothetical protein
MEPIFGATACEQHKLATERAMHRIRTMPPEAKPIHQVWRRVLEEEIASPSYDA